MSDMGLQFVEAPPTPETFNVLLFGSVGSGKSTAAATAPGPILWVNAEGRGALAYARKVAHGRGTSIFEVEVRADGDTRDVLRDVLLHLKGDAEPRPATVVVDTLAKVRDALVRQLVQPGAKNSLQQYGEVNRILGGFITVLRDLPVNLVVLAHEDIQDVEGDRIVEPLIGGALTRFVPGEVDVVAYTGVSRDDDGNARYLGQLVEGRGRRAKDRSGGLGAVRDLDLTEWLAAYRAALTPDETDVPWAAAEDHAGASA